MTLTVTFHLNELKICVGISEIVFFSLSILYDESSFGNFNQRYNLKLTSSFS